jgi:WD40 repeat protein
VASGSADKTIRIWEVSTGECESTLSGHSGYVTAVSYSCLFSNVWCVLTIEGLYRSVESVRFSPDGKQVASGSADSTVKIWQVSTGECESTLTGHPHFVNSVAWNNDGTKLASGSCDRTVRIWSVGSAGTFECQSTLSGHSSW